MSRKSSGIKLWKLAVVGVALGTAGFVAVSGPALQPSAKSERIDPTIEERIKQARGLQKVGRWDDAADILTQLASDGHPVALFHLGRAYKNGWGVDADLNQARLLFMEAVRYSFAYRGETAYELGRLFQRSAGEHCVSIALQWFNKALAWDYPKAHVQLAKHYERGIGTERNMVQAFDHYEQAAIAGYPSSTINYARILLTGRYNTVPDTAQALFWASRAMEGLEKKARDGSASAAKTLGRIYRDGEFVDKNTSTAEDWFLRSAELGDAGAMHDLGHMILAGDPSGEEIETALEWFDLAAKARHGGALTNLARMHLKEQYGLTRDGAVTLLTEAIEVGHPGAMEELAKLYAKGDLVEKSLKKAHELAQKGADRGHQGSVRFLNELNEKHPTLASETAATQIPASTKKEG
ncbi:tetratricopeptide repeat protein [Roseibium sp. RKSG952]|uniref:tetratricopeptide repeat protein n=1 Tax=Roseibium sp. RKSG952 TaxID=2529384 RepID=UPI0018AD24DC|nr:tetratricopeptide repeat protein [Roseibium sp. RKSG952]